MLERDLKVLGLRPGAGNDDIRKAYREMAKKYHPDLSGYNTSALFERVTHAYKNLTVRDDLSRVVRYPVRETPVSRSKPAQHEKNPLSELGEMLLYGTSGEQRAFAAKKLGNSGKKTAFAYLKKGLSDTDPLVVRSSIEAIGMLRVYQSAGDLSCVFSRGGSETKLEVLKAVEKIGLVGGFKNIVIRAMKDPAPMVRIKGVSLFARAGVVRRHNG